MKKISLTIVMMLVMSMFITMSFVMNESVQAATTYYVDSDGSIQDVINNATAGDTIIVNSTGATTVTYFAEDIIVNTSITLESRNGSAYTWINGSINVTVNDTTIGGKGDVGFTIYQSTIDTATIHAVNISTNASRDNITIRSCIIIGGYDGVHIGHDSYTDNETSNLTIYDCIIRDTGRSAIYAGPGQLVTANFSLLEAYNTSNTIYGDIICIDGGNDVLIYYSNLYDTTSTGGMGINSTGASNHLTNFRIDKNTIWDVDGYSPICIVSDTDARTVENVRITFNDLENNSNPYTEAAIRFDNLSGILTATNISVFYNNINTTGNDIEEQFGAVGTYKNWTGVMKAYFNWYGGFDTAGTFNDSEHLYASPWLRIGSAAGHIWTGTDYLEGSLSGDILNATAESDVLLELLTSTDNVGVVVYPYGLGGASNPEGTIYPARAMHNYKEIGVSNTSLITFPVNITVYYDAADLAIRGWSESRINGLAFYNESSGEWEDFNNTGKNTTYDSGDYLGFVWAVAYTESQITGTVICINYNAIIPEDENGVAPYEEEPGLDSDGDGYTDAEEVLAGSDPYDASSTPLTVAAAVTFLGLDWYWWIAIIVILIFFIIAVYFALNPKAWKRFKKKF